MTQAQPAVRLPASPTGFVGRERETAEVIRLLQDYRLVTVTGPGGVGKTRLAAEVARRVADQFPDGVYFVELSAVTDETRVPARVAAALGIPQAAGRSVPETLAAALSARRVLLVLDNCEHLLAAAARLCADQLKAADDVRVLATSREQLWIGGEARYRLFPLQLPGAGEPRAAGPPAAVALFAECARQADPEFSLTPEFAPLAARVVTRLDGMPLAIELAAARIKTLGMAGLADRIDDGPRLLDGEDALAPDRHQSLAAVADWSYRLLTPPEQRVFRRLAVFPGPFTLEAADAVAGPEAGLVVLRLVDCSLLVPPRPGPDQRMRYTLLQILRAYGLARLAEAGEEREAAAALAAFARSVAEDAGAGLDVRDREVQAVRWLDAEDATLSAAVSWTLEHDPAGALRLATALAPWWRLRGRMIEGYQRLTLAVQRSAPDGGPRARAQLWLGNLAQLASPADGLAHYNAAYEPGDARQSADALAARSIWKLNYGQLAEAADDARRALALAREAGYAGGKAQALTVLCFSAHCTGAGAAALDWARQAEESLGAEVPDWLGRWCRVALAIALTESGELSAARRVFGDSVARSREVGDLAGLTNLLMAWAQLERLSGDQESAWAYLREAVEIAGRTGLPGPTIAAEEDHARRAALALAAGQARDAAERGAQMTLAAAGEFVTMLTAPEGTSVPRTAGELTKRERELVTLVARGHTNTEIAAHLSISVRTVTSHLDRIRDKTGYRRRADLTRLALSKDLAYVSGTGPAGARAAGPPRKGVVQPLCGTRPAQADG